MLEGAKRRASMCQAFQRIFFIRGEYIVPVSSNFLTQISCGIKTNCRKTRAMQRDFTIVDSLALRQCNTSMIPDTHLLKLLFPTRYTPRSIHQDFYQAFYIREIYIVSVSSNFPVPKGHDANFAWNQYETAVKFVRE